ncbi:hypothetical protein ACMD2_11913, partial [Ananas comosus]
MQKREDDKIFTSHVRFDERVGEFESEWALVIEKYKLNDNNHSTLL